MPNIREVSVKVKREIVQKIGKNINLYIPQKNISYL